MNESERRELREEREQLRDAYAELFAEVTEILARHDLMDLVGIGAPADEYEPEVGTILPRLRDAADADDVQRILHEEFVRWFDADIPMAPQAEFAATAAEIWAVWRRLGPPSAV